MQLFNATSLREATRGTSLNMTLYLFTIVTIIYTPIGFLAVRNPPRFERSADACLLDILGHALAQQSRES